jgi:hypothetical protein
MRMLGPFAAVLALTLVAACHDPQKPDHPVEVVGAAQFAQPADKIFPKVMRYLAAHSVAPSTIDKEHGVILASAPLAPVGWVVCEHVRGDEVNQKFNLSISLDGDGSSTTVTVSLNGQYGGKTRNHFIFIPTSSDITMASCTSTGVMEKELFSALAQ